MNLRIDGMGRMRWSNSRLHRVFNCWLMGGLLGYGSPSISLIRPGGRPTFREAWTGVIEWPSATEWS